MRSEVGYKRMFLIDKKDYNPLEKCKWKYMKNNYSGFVFESCKGKKFADLHNFKYCPYCGKEIKVV